MPVTKTKVSTAELVEAKKERSLGNSRSEGIRWAMGSPSLNLIQTDGLKIPLAVS